MLAVLFLQFSSPALHINVFPFQHSVSTLTCRAEQSGEELEVFTEEVMAW